MSVEKIEPVIHIFIISWNGQHAHALKIAESLAGVQASIFLIYSDLDPSLQLKGSFTPICRSNNTYWEDKFQACLERVGEAYMLVIHADCACEDWPSLYYNYRKSIAQYRAIGVWAPLIDGTPYDWERVRIAQIPNSSLGWALQTDAVVFGLAPRVVQRMRRVQYGGNPYGWGIDRLFCAAAFVRQLWVVIDDRCRVNHPRSRGYDPALAQVGMEYFYTQFDPSERVYQQMCDEILSARQKSNLLIF